MSGKHHGCAHMEVQQKPPLDLPEFVGGRYRSAAWSVSNQSRPPACPPVEDWPDQTGMKLGRQAEHLLYVRGKPGPCGLRETAYNVPHIENCRRGR